MSLKGIDISHYQKGLNAANIDADFIIMKATEGVSMVDNCCDTFYQAAKHAGKCLGVYHFATSADPIQQAKHFLKNVQGYIGEAMLILDWEASALRLGPSGAKKWLDYVYSQTGIKPVIYMSKSVCRQYDWSSVVAGDYGLWSAQYANSKATGYQSSPWTDSKGTGAWSGPCMYQYSSHGRLSGWSGNLDLDIFYGDRKAWLAYAGSKSSGNGHKTESEETTMEPHDVWEYVYGDNDNCYNTLFKIYNEVCANSDIVGDGYTGDMYTRIAYIDHQTRDLADKIAAMQSSLDAITKNVDNLAESLGILGIGNLTVTGDVHLEKKEE